MNAIDIFTKEYLEEHYVRRGKSSRQIAEENGYASASVVNRYLGRHNITKKNAKPSKVLTKEVLQTLYVEQQLSVKCIARTLGLRSHTSVRMALKEHGIPVRSPGWQSPDRMAAHVRLRTGYNDINGSYWCSIRTAAAKRNLTFSITLEYVWGVWETQGGRCALSGVPINLVGVRKDVLDGKEEQTASLDRIDSTSGYVEGNVQWVHKRIQRIKWDMPDNEFIHWCMMVAQTHGGK